MKQNPLLKLEALGQSIWIDFISRGTTASGELQRLIEEDGVSGVTSNPSIFEKAIAESDDYAETIRSLTLEGKAAEEVYLLLTVEDIQLVADLLRPTYDQTDGQDGFVSLEVSPKLAHDTNGTIEEARRLWSLVDRPNSMIKVPATREGLPAIQQLTGEGTRYQYYATVRSSPLSAGSRCLYLRPGNSGKSWKKPESGYFCCQLFPQPH